ncbi:MAG: hypothetical protein HY834_15990 [Devosia nanyangense]|uniref:Uncharacterized protein n=1 Tax=Devosia nanyangense TaxID=1228055 RepID=A0A933NZY8_9HYPH|nr:hypothetical protein [Devosia nanyangense]
MILDDCWPLEGYGALVEFERNDRQAVALVVTFRNQSVDLAPQVRPLSGGLPKAEINIRGNFALKARQIVGRFTDYLNLHSDVLVDTDNFAVEYLLVDETERTQLHVFNFTTSTQLPPSRLAFSMVAQAFFAGEGTDDPSFASHLSRTAREALANERYIDAFRYGFLLIEAMYGDGNFKTKQLVASLRSNATFMAILTDTMTDLATSRISEVRTLMASHATPEKLVEHLVDRRGFYFHGNAKHQGAWHPNQHQAAQPIAEVAVLTAAGIAHSFSSAMFAPHIGSRHFDNARKQGAIMSFIAEIRFLDAHGFERTRTINVNTPGTALHNQLALRLHKDLLETVEVEMRDCQVIAIAARETKSGREVFKANYLAQVAERETSEHPPESD